MIRKLAILSTVLIVAVLVCGCTQTTKQATTGNSNVNTSGLTLNVNTADVVQNQTSNLKAGYKYIGFNCTIHNNNLNDRSVGWSFFTLRDNQGNVYTPVWLPSMKGQFNSVTSEPGDNIKGIVVFEVPQNATLKTLTYNDGSLKIVTNL